jgi:hypothetical protein
LVYFLKIRRYKAYFDAGVEFEPTAAWRFLPRIPFFLFSGFGWDAFFFWGGCVAANLLSFDFIRDRLSPEQLEELAVFWAYAWNVVAVLL